MARTPPKSPSNLRTFPEDFGERRFELRRHHVRSSDNLAENMAESAVTALTSGEYQDIEDTDDLLEEELGGPFIETSAEDELGFDDTAYPPEASVEPFPRTQGGIGDDDEADDVGDATG